MHYSFIPCFKITLNTKGKWGGTGYPIRSMDKNLIGLIFLIVLVLGLAYLVNQHSQKRSPIYGGTLSLVFNFLSGLFFVAIFPSVCMSVLVFHPTHVDVAGIIFNPVLLLVIVLSLLSLTAALLFAIVEKMPLEQANAEKLRHEQMGWTEQDAKTSGL